jgi:predicted aspartyl protease
MGMFEVKVKLANLAAMSRTEEVSLLVDTRATLSWIPRTILEKLGVNAFSRLPFTLADGRHIERDTTAVLMTVDGRKATVSVAYGESGEEAVLGLTALEALGFIADPVGKKLVSRNLRALYAAGTNGACAAYANLEKRFGVLALSRTRAEGVRNCTS